LTAVYGPDYDELTAEEFLNSFSELDFTLNITDSGGDVTASGTSLCAPRRNMHIIMMPDTAVFLRFGQEYNGEGRGP
jgi:hypothetical protein